jgi:uncharacterized protein YbbK (DUF523 family)
MRVVGSGVFVVCAQSYKKDSPSSGLFRVKVYNEHGMAQKNGTSMFPRHLKNHLSSEDNAYLRQVGAPGP